MKNITIFALGFASCLASFVLGAGCDTPSFSVDDPEIDVAYYGQVCQSNHMDSIRVILNDLEIVSTDHNYDDYAETEFDLGDYHFFITYDEDGNFFGHSQEAWEITPIE